MTNLEDMLEDMTREQLIGQIMYLRKKISQLEEAASETKALLLQDSC